MDGYLEQKAPLLKQIVKGRELPHETVNLKTQIEANFIMPLERNQYLFLDNLPSQLLR